MSKKSIRKANNKVDSISSQLALIQSDPSISEKKRTRLRVATTIELRKAQRAVAKEMEDYFESNAPIKSKEMRKILKKWSK